MPNHALDLWCLLEEERFWAITRGSHAAVLSSILDLEDFEGSLG